MKQSSIISPVPLTAFPVFNTRSPELFVNTLRSNFHDTKVDVFRERSFRATYNYLDLGRISLHGADFSSGYCIRSDPTMSNLVFVLMQRGEMIFESRRARYSCLPGAWAAMVDFLHPLTVVQKHGYRHLSIRCIRLGIEESLARLTGVTGCTPLIFVNPIDLATPSPRRLARIATHVTELFDQDPELAKVPLLVAQYEELLLTALLTCLPHNHTHLLRVAPPPATPKVVQLAEAYIEANADKPLRLKDLVPVTGMGVRSIQLAFQQYRGYSPSRFLRECRLAKARQMLRQSFPGTTVLSVALACGFASQNHFSRYYRDRFGENPSETLNKNFS